MSKLSEKLISACKEAIADVQGKKFIDFLSSFRQRQDAANKADDKELEEFMRLLRGVFSMFFPILIQDRPVF
ncbi:MAG: hypothetical protein V1869_06620 [Candidatus Omnitrophota bacterium]